MSISALHAAGSGTLAKDFRFPPGGLSGLRRQSSQVISSCAFHLKGSGWYVTDYAGKNPASGASDNGDGAKAAGSGACDASPGRRAQDRGRACFQDKMTHLLSLPGGRERER